MPEYMDTDLVLEQSADFESQIQQIAKLHINHAT